MVELITVLVVALLVIAAAAITAPKLRIAAPLLLVLVGIAVSLAPWPGDVVIEPEWILEGLLPPLLYASGVAMPTMNFRREFRAISSMSVLLVVASALLLGLLFAWLIPGIGFVWGVALGAIISPTDAVATSIIKGTRVPGRVLVLLDGESLLNDATALVVLRTAVVATAAAFSFWGALGTFAYSVAVAVAVGVAVGLGNLAVRRRVGDSTVNTILSFTVPFVASVPAELLGGSGLVAAVVAGLVTGIRAPRVLPARHRISDAQNWASVELVLEGLIFLGMGLQLSTVLREVEHEHAGVGPAIGIAAIALLATLLIRAGYVAPLLFGLGRRTKQWEVVRPRAEDWRDRLASGEPIPGIDRDGLAGPRDLARTASGEPAPIRRDRDRRARRANPRDLARLTTRVRRMLADIQYFLDQPLGPREGVVVVWAGMRGAVTVTAAQTLPAETPQRALLVFVAFAVATMSLLVQGGTIGLVVARLFPAGDEAERVREEIEQRGQVLALLDQVEQSATRSEGQSEKRYRLAVLTAQRDALLDARDDGTVDADTLTTALTGLDVKQMALELSGGSDG